VLRRDIFQQVSGELGGGKEPQPKPSRYSNNVIRRRKTR
jgi:hypothetical protein